MIGTILGSCGLAVTSLRTALDLYELLRSKPAHRLDRHTGGPAQCVRPAPAPRAHGGERP